MFRENNSPGDWYDPGRRNGQENGSKAARGTPVVLWIALAVFFVTAVIGFLILRPKTAEGREKPYGGAKVKKQTVWENEYVSVTAEGIINASGDYYYCDALGLTVKNKSDQEIRLSCASLAVNGAALQPVLSAEADPGETAKAELVMDNYSFDDMKVKTPDSFTMELSLTDRSGTELSRSGILTVVTTRKGKGDSPDYKYPAKALHDESGISVGSEGFRPAGTTMRYGVCFHVDNSSGRTVRFTAKDIVLNDLPFDTEAEAFFQDGSRGVCYAWTDFRELEEIDKKRPLFPITRVSGTCAVYDAESGEKLTEFPFKYEK